MRPRRLLYLTSDRMEAFLWNAGDPAHEGSFSSSPDGLAGFKNYLERGIDSVFSLLVDVAEEDMYTETLPFLQGADREAVLSRRLGQIFFSSALTASQSLGYQKTQRKEERVMLFALTNSAFLAPWLALFRQTEIALSGIYSPLLLASRLLKKSRLADENCLLFMVQNQSLRQFYFEKGELRFSRLTAIKNDNISGIAHAIAEETPKLKQYIGNQSRHYEASQQPITAHVVLHKQYLNDLRATCADTRMIHFNLLDIDDCFQKAGLKQSPSALHSEWIFLGLMATSPSSVQFATDALRHNYHIRVAKNVLHGVGLAVLVVCLAISGSFLYQWNTLIQKADSLETQAQTTRGYYEAAVKTFPPLPASVETLRRVIGRYMEMDRQSISPEGLYIEISRALERAPSIEIDTIYWKMALEELGPAEAPPIPQAVRVPDNTESALILGTIRLGANAHPRQILEMFNLFVAALESTPKIRTAVLKRPFDIEPEKVLKGSDMTLTDERPSTFIVQIFREIGA